MHPVTQPSLMAAASTVEPAVPLYLAVAGQTLYGDPFASGNTPYCYIYKKGTLGSGNFTRIATLTMPSWQAAFCCRFSPNGTYLAVSGGGSSADRVNIWKRSGDSFTNLGGLSFFGTAEFGLSWSSDSTYLAVAGSSTNEYLRVYKRSGDTFSKLSTITQPTSTAWDCDFSGNSNKYLSFALDASPRYNTFKRSGDTFTKVANSTTLPSDAGTNVSWYEDSTLVVGVSTATPTIYNVNAATDEHTLATTPTQPAGQTIGVAWNPDKSGFFLNCYTGQVYQYVRNSSTSYTRYTQPSISFNNTYNFLFFNSKPAFGGSQNDPRYVAIVSRASPFINMYERQTSRTTWVQLPSTVFSQLPPQQANSAHFYYGI